MRYIFPLPALSHENRHQLLQKRRPAIHPFYPFHTTTFFFVHQSKNASPGLAHISNSPYLPIILQRKVAVNNFLLFPHVFPHVPRLPGLHALRFCHFTSARNDVCLIISYTLLTLIHFYATLKKRTNWRSFHCPQKMKGV